MEQILINLSRDAFKGMIGSVLYDNMAPYMSVVKPVVEVTQNNINQEHYVEQKLYDELIELQNKIKDYASMSLIELYELLNYENIYRIRLKLLYNKSLYRDRHVIEFLNITKAAVKHMLQLYVGHDFSVGKNVRLYLKSFISDNEYALMFPENLDDRNIILHCEYMHTYKHWCICDSKSDKQSESVTVDLDWIVDRYMSYLGLNENDLSGKFLKIFFEFKHDNEEHNMMQNAYKYEKIEPLEPISEE